MNIVVILYSGAIGLVVIGLMGLLLHNNLFRMLLALAIAEAGANILLVLAGFSEGAIAPIIVGNNAGQLMNDPVPQALVLTAIVIGVGIQALALALVIKVQQHYGTLNMSKIREQMEKEIASSAGVSAPVSNHSPGVTNHPGSTSNPETTSSHESLNSPQAVLTQAGGKSDA
jgi:multisubunit Na+/H+ antiporter MnhC subunit